MTADLEFLTDDPPNAATPLHRLDGSPLPQDLVYLRNNFSLPTRPPDSIVVEIGSTVRVIEPAGLAGLPQRRCDMVLECAGNGRIYMEPTPDGTPWNFGGVSPVVFSGPSLLDAIGAVSERFSELVFTGADAGEVEPEGLVSYQFSLERSLWSRAVLATHMNDTPLGLLHGGPVRLVVPGEYAMKSVKWLTRIGTTESPFTGHFVNKYRYFEDPENVEGAPVGPIQVRSLIARPDAGEVIGPGPFTIRGSAWSGLGPVVAVEVAIDDGEWTGATLSPRPGKYSATPWSFRMDLGPGPHTVAARAHDGSDRSQPLASRWNRNGYANNVVHSVAFEVV